MNLLNKILIIDLQVAMALVVLVASVLLFLRRRGWGTFLLVVGATGLFITSSLNYIAATSASGGWIGMDSPFWSSRILDIFDRVGLFASFCFPIGFLWHVLKLVRHV